MRFRLLILMFLVSVAICNGQTSAPENWFNLDMGTDKVSGVSTERTYSELLKGKTSETVIVAVIDSGVDPEHEDLKEIMWVNQDEIPNNGIDDDGNGYIDDIHGWNFIGGKNGNIKEDALEIARLVNKYNKMFKGRDEATLSKKEKKEYKFYQEIKGKIDKKQEELKQQSAGYMAFAESLNTIKKSLGKEDITLEDLNSFETDDEDVKRVATRIATIMKSEGVSFSDVNGEVQGAANHFGNQMNYLYNPEFDPRAEIVGDNYSDSYDRNYGNNDVKGPDAAHGTHVAGIIAAVRDNDLGIKGVADNVRIMSVRAVPDGDERDIDVANAIIYAVDNGASIINMSFGKSYAWDKEAVDKAVKYACKKDVLLVHAAGNDARNTNDGSNFPNDKYKKSGWFKSKTAKNWIEVGALSWKTGKDAVAGFSNYGSSQVDLFAPGHHINSTTPDQGYAKFSGTSMASPVTAGVAAVLRSYFPTLSAKQVKEILMTTVVPQNQKVKKPGSDDLVSFSELCQTAGVVNTYTAVKKAMVTKGKKKVKKASKKNKMVKP